MSDPLMRARVNAAYDDAMREATGLRLSYERYALRLIFLIHLGTGIAFVIAAALLVWLVSCEP